MHRIYHAGVFFIRWGFLLFFFFGLVFQPVLAASEIPLQFFTYSQIKLSEQDDFSELPLASGSGTYTTDENGQTQLDFRFSTLIPNTMYQLSCYRTALPPIDLHSENLCPNGDWTDYGFRSDAEGNGTLGFHLPSPLPESTQELVTILTLSTPELGRTSRVQLLSILPAKEIVATPVIEKTTEPQRMRWSVLIGGLLFVGLGAWWVAKRTLTRQEEQKEV